MADLIVIYGAPLTGKTTLAWELARSLEGPTAVISADQLLGGSIAVAGPDAAAELEMVHTQLRLLVANFLKNRYNVVVEGPFLYERDGAVIDYEADIDQLVALMRHLTARALVVRLTAPAAVLSSRAAAAGREGELGAAMRTEGAYKERYGVRFFRFDTSLKRHAAIVLEINHALESQQRD
jgi:hypothetical protein